VVNKPDLPDENAEYGLGMNGQDKGLAETFSFHWRLSVSEYKWGLGQSCGCRDGGFVGRKTPDSPDCYGY